jgi:integrase
LVIAVDGACRSDELCNMLVADVNIKDDMIVINIPTSKNGSSRKFVMMEVLWIEIVKKYLKMRPTPDMPRLFISKRNGKATTQNIGHNTIGEMPKKIAIYLNLPNPRSYTGHCFRRTSATILASRGGNTLQLKQHGGWKSSNVAEGYVKNSLSIKKKIAQMVQGSSTSNRIS